MCPHAKQFVQRPGSPVLEEVETSVQEAVADSPKCNIWWFLVIAGGVFAVWLGTVTMKHLDLREETGKSQAVQQEQFKHILYRLDEIDKKLDKRVSSSKIDTLASKEE
jgi:hypothetical protein